MFSENWGYSRHIVQSPHDETEFRVSCFIFKSVWKYRNYHKVQHQEALQCCNTYPDLVVTLDKLWVSKQTPLQYGLQESQVDHVEQQQPQNGQINYDCNLRYEWYDQYNPITEDTINKWQVLLKQSVTNQLKQN